MKRNTINKIILVLLISGLLTVMVLSVIQIVSIDICPTVLGIPACYILFLAISAMIISHLELISDKNVLFFTGIGIILAIAIYASFYQMNSRLECPKEPIFETPMCYLSFLLFSVILGLKFLEIKSAEN